MSPSQNSRFSKAFRDWARRPTDLSPRHAAERIGRRLLERETRPAEARHRRLAFTAAAVAVVVALGSAWILDTFRAPDQGPPAPALDRGTVESPALDEDIAVFWLDENTPLYLTLSPLEPKEEPPS